MVFKLIIEKINKINELLARVTKKNERRHQLPASGMKGVITTDTGSGLTPHSPTLPIAGLGEAKSLRTANCHISPEETRKTADLRTDEGN